MYIALQYREQARRVYYGAVFEAMKEILVEARLRELSVQSQRYPRIEKTKSSGYSEGQNCVSNPFAEKKRSVSREESERVASIESEPFRVSFWCADFRRVSAGGGRLRADQEHGRR